MVSDVVIFVASLLVKSKFKNKKFMSNQIIYIQF